MTGKLSIVAGVGLGLLASTAWGETGSVALMNANQNALAITVYQNNLGVVRDQRTLALTPGQSTVLLNGLGNAVIPDSLDLVLTGDDVWLTDLVANGRRLSYNDILERLVGQTVTWASTNPATGAETRREGRLIAMAPQPVIQFGDEVSFNPPGRAVFAPDQVPLEMMSSAVASIKAGKKTQANTDLVYLSQQVSWNAGYTARLLPDNNSLMLSADIVLTNNSGRDFNDAAVTVVAGEINKAGHGPIRPMGAQLKQVRSMAADVEMAAPAPQPESTQDYWRYDLSGKRDIPDGATVKIPLLNQVTVPVTKKFVLENGVQNYPVRNGNDGDTRRHPTVNLTFKNEDQSGLGQPLPAGLIRVFNVGDDEGRAPTLLGEDSLQSTPEGELVRLQLGEAFDVTAERNQKTYERIDDDPAQFETTYEIVLRNAKPVGTAVDVVEWMPGDWEILDESAKHVRKDARRAVWSVSVPAKGQATLTYKVRITN